MFEAGPAIRDHAVIGAPEPRMKKVQGLLLIFTPEGEPHDLMIKD